MEEAVLTMEEAVFDHGGGQHGGPCLTGIVLIIYGLKRRADSDSGASFSSVPYSG